MANAINAYLTVDLGFGDAGKGATVDWLCREFSCDLVIRYSGGHQCGHSVQLPDGRRHKFSQFGSGYFAGANTYLASSMIINPGAIVREAQALGPDAMQTIRAHPNCLVTTDYHIAMNRIRHHNEKKDGTCGLGIGETRRYWEEYGLDAIFASDIADATQLGRKLDLLKRRLWNIVRKRNYDVTAADDLSLIPVHETYAALRRAGSQLGVDTAPQYFTNVCFEAAQGVLLDQDVGTAPHTTWSDVTLQPAEELLNQMQAVLDIGTVKRYGIVRSTTHRHGHGPLPTFDLALSLSIVDLGNLPDTYQGVIRHGWFDMELFKYAIRNCNAGGSGLDGVIVNCLDQLPPQSKYCSQYLDAGDAFTRTRRTQTAEDQACLTQWLKDSTPVYTDIQSPAGLLSAIGEILPVFAAANGPCWTDRKLA